jgi:ArsR family transcriptional regulator
MQRIDRGRAESVCGDIVDEVPLAQSTGSQHLKVLKDARILRVLVVYLQG